MSNYQDKHARFMITIFDYLGIELCEELNIPGTTHRIDLGSRDFKYGIEIKSGSADFATGCGTNQEYFAYGYLLCSDHFSAPAIGRLYQKGMFHTGVIVWDGYYYRIIKPARYNHNSLWAKQATSKEQEKEWLFPFANNELTTILDRRESDEDLQSVIFNDIPRDWTENISNTK